MVRGLAKRGYNLEFPRVEEEYTDQVCGRWVMLLIEERKNSPISITCRCGRNLELSEGASVFTVGDRKITLNYNAPIG